MKKFSKKHIAIFQKIEDKGLYKPTYSDKEPATLTLIKNQLIDWRSDFKGLIFTELGKTTWEKLKSSIEN